MAPPLTAKQQFVLNKRFGLEGERPHSVSELAGMLNVTPGAIVGMQRAAIWKVARDASLVSPQSFAAIYDAKTRISPAVFGTVA